MIAGSKPFAYRIPFLGDRARRKDEQEAACRREMQLSALALLPSYKQKIDEGIDLGNLEARVPRLQGSDRFAIPPEEVPELLAGLFLNHKCRSTGTQNGLNYVAFSFNSIGDCAVNPYRVVGGLQAVVAADELLAKGGSKQNAAAARRLGWETVYNARQAAGIVILHDPKTNRAYEYGMSSPLGSQSGRFGTYSCAEVWYGSSTPSVRGCQLALLGSVHELDRKNPNWRAVLTEEERRPYGILYYFGTGQTAGVATAIEWAKNALGVNFLAVERELLSDLRGSSHLVPANAQRAQIAVGIMDSLLRSK